MKSLFFRLFIALLFALQGVQAQAQPPFPDLQVTFSDCDSLGFFDATVDIDYPADPLDQFELSINGASYSFYTYGELPIQISHMTSTLTYIVFGIRVGPGPNDFFGYDVLAPDCEPAGACSKTWQSHCHPAMPIT